MAPEQEPPDREQRVLQLLQQANATERAPASLRAEVESLRARSDRGTRSGSARRRSGWSVPAMRLRVASLAVTPLAALAVVLVLVLGGGSSGPPTVMQAAALAGKGPVAAAPAVDPTAPRLLDARVGDLHFPDWEAQGGWRSTGTRTDQLGSRAVTTVYYQHAGKQLAYSIVDSPALAKSVPVGEDYKTFQQDGRTFVVWTVANHTCLLSAQGVTPEHLWSLARSTEV